SLVIWLLWAALAVLLAVAIPGAAILLLAPALVAALAPASRLAPALAALLAAAVWAPLAPGLVEALGLSAPLVGAAVGWLCTAFLPTCSEEHGGNALSLWPWSSALLAALAAAVAGLAPRFDADHPDRARAT